MESPVALVGWSGPPPCGAGRFERIRPEARALARLRTRALIVLGDAALATLDPRAVADRLARSEARVLLFPQRCSYELLVPWLRAGVGVLTTAARLPDDAEVAIARAGRPRLATCEWLGADPPDAVDAARAIAALDTMDRLTVGAWSAALGWSRHRLARTCERRLGAAASDVLWRFVSATARRMRDDGAPLVRVADALGFSEASSLVRAFRRRGEFLAPPAASAAPRRPASIEDTA